MVINPALMLRMPYDTLRDFAPITLVVVQPMCLVVHPSLPVKTVKDLTALARARPGQLNTPEEFTAHIKAELAKWANAVRMAGARPH